MKSRVIIVFVFLIVLLFVVISGSLFAAPGNDVQRDNNGNLAYLPAIFGDYPVDMAGIDSGFWPTMQHDAARTGYNAAERELYPPLEQVWSEDLGTWNQVENITTADDDLAITGPTAGFRYNQVIMLDANNGSKRWDFTLPNGGGGSMLVAATFDDDSVYFGGQDDSHFYSLFRNSGATKWQKSGFENLLGSEIAVVDGIVYVPDSSVGVIALTADTGDIKWGAGYSGNGAGLPLSYRNGTVYGVRGGTELVALDATVGTEQWAFSPVPEFPWIIADSNQVIVKSGNSEIRSLNPTDGSTIYAKTFDFDLGVGALPALAKGMLFVPTYSANDDDPDIVALNAANGGFLWSYEYDPGSVSDLVVSNGIVYFAGTDIIGDGNGVFGLDATSGKLIWSASLPDSGSVRGLAVSDGTLFVGHYSGSSPFVPGTGMVYAFRNAN